MAARQPHPFAAQVVAVSSHVCHVDPCLQSPGALLRLDASDAWFSSEPGVGGNAIFPSLADLFKDPAPSSVLNL